METTNLETPQTTRDCEICSTPFPIGGCTGRPPKFCPACRGSEDRRKDRERSSLARKARRVEAFTRAYSYLMRNPCVDCGLTDPLFLEFDHVHGERLGSLWSSLGAEMWIDEADRCEVRCVSCLAKKDRGNDEDQMEGLQKARELAKDGLPS